MLYILYKQIDNQTNMQTDNAVSLKLKMKTSFTRLTKYEWAAARAHFSVAVVDLFYMFKPQGHEVYYYLILFLVYLICHTITFHVLLASKHGNEFRIWCTGAHMLCNILFIKVRR